MADMANTATELQDELMKTAQEHPDKAVRDAAMVLLKAQVGAQASAIIAQPSN